YRLYTDASDEALGACLQQIQDIRIGDLVGAPVYDRLRRAYDAGEPIPQLCTKLSSKVQDVPDVGVWAESFDDTVVHVERVIAYWSRTFKNAELNYSATEREGLAAKEALIKFQPFVEGEEIILITDHAALQWAPKQAKSRDELGFDQELEQVGEEVSANEVPTVELSSTPATRRPDEPAAKLSYEEKLKWKAANPPPTLLVGMSPALRKRYSKGYDSDPAFYRGKDGLLFFRDADFMPRLCVPRGEQAALLRQVHESPFEMAHAGAEKMYQRLSKQFFWPKMLRDVELFCKTCDVCQKDKYENDTRHGFLQPHSIPELPYQRVSLDLVVGLPWSGSFNAILVIVDLLSKHAQFIPTDSGLDTEGFARLFVMHVVSRFGLPFEFIADRDGRWLSLFFQAVTQQMGIHMLLSSSHHPQHDGQTERTNRTLETMLRHYVEGNPESWDQWLPSMEFAYNSTPHASTGKAPYFLLYGFQPRSPTSILNEESAEGIPRYITADKN
ncbi:ribonuclease H-like protein, partial [Exidia glandulosa HHB12029]